MLEMKEKRNKGIWLIVDTFHCLHKCFPGLSDGRGLLSVAWLGETGLRQFFFQKHFFPLPPQSDHLLLLGTHGHWPPILNGQPEKQPNSTYLGPFYGIHWTQRNLTASWQHERREFRVSPFLCSSLFLCGGVSDNRKGMHAGSSIAYQVGYPGKPLMRVWDSSLYFLGHPEFLRDTLSVGPSLGLGKRNIMQSPLSLWVIKVIILSSAVSLSSTYMDLGSGRGKGVILMMSGLVVRSQEKFLFRGIYFVGNVANRRKQVMKLHP